MIQFDGEFSLESAKSKAQSELRIYEHQKEMNIYSFKQNLP